MKAPDFPAIGSFLQKVPEILFAYAFGSQVSRTASARSDLDLAIYAQPPLGDDALQSLQTELMELARRKAIDLVDLRRTSPVLAYEVVTSGRLLFTKDEDATNRFERQALLRYFDTQHMRNIQERYLRERLHGA